MQQFSDCFVMLPEEACSLQLKLLGLKWQSGIREIWENIVEKKGQKESSLLSGQPTKWISSKVRTVSIFMYLFIYF